MTWHTERPPAVAGTFYPADPTTLGGTVDALLADAVRRRAGRAGPLPAAPLRALVCPHAGYVYSGPVAASSYDVLVQEAPRPTRVVLLGPDHFVGTAGMSVPSVDSYRTPLGSVAIDDRLRAVALRDGALTDDLPHAREHSLEVQVPFLQRILDPGWTLLPVVVGPTGAGSVASLLAALLRSAPDALVVVSSDLSHYYDHATAQRLDRRTADSIVARDPDGIGPEDACGRYPLRGLLALARDRGWEVTLLDLRTSADTAGDHRRVVGYGAFAVRGTP